MLVEEEAESSVCVSGPEMARGTTALGGDVLKERENQ